jgi:hypothetical protein
VHGSAVAGGATPVATLSAMAVANATDIDAVRGRGDMSHLSKAQDVAQTSRSADVTIVINGAFVISDVPIGIYP